MAKLFICLFLYLLGPALAATGCKNQGVQWAGYNNTSGPNNDPTYSTFQTPAYSGTKPVYHAVTSYVGGNYLANVTSPGHMSIYGSKFQFSVVNYVLNHQGYVHAPADGTYTFAANTIDDVLLMWFGSKAQSGWTRANADCNAALNIGSGVYPSCTHSVTLKKGQYLPFRMLYGQWNGGSAAFIKFTGPSGQTLLDSTTSKSNSIVQYGCGKAVKQAPKFSAWSKPSSPELNLTSSGCQRILYFITLEKVGTSSLRLLISLCLFELRLQGIHDGKLGSMPDLM